MADETPYDGTPELIADMCARAVHALVNQRPSTPHVHELKALIEPILERYWQQIHNKTYPPVQTGQIAPGKGVTLYDHYGNSCQGQEIKPENKRLAELRKHLATLLSGVDGSCKYQEHANRFQIVIGKFEVKIADDPYFAPDSMARYVQRAYDRYCDEQVAKRFVAMGGEKDWVFWKGAQWTSDEVFKMSANEEYCRQYLAMLSRDFLDHTIVKAMVLGTYCGVKAHPSGKLEGLKARDVYEPLQINKIPGPKAYADYKGDVA